MRILGGRSSKLCESPLSLSLSSLSIIISLILNVSLKSTFFDFVLVGKNGDENSSSSLLNILKKEMLTSAFLSICINIQTMNIPVL